MVVWHDLAVPISTLSVHAGTGGRMRVYFNRYILFLLGLSMFWTLCIFIAPLTIPPHSVEHLEHGTSSVDFNDNWSKLPVFAHVVYLIGDSQCHQLSERTYYINGNEMPLCSRCMALFTWANLGLITAMLLVPKYDISQTAAQLFPRKLRKYLEEHDKTAQAWALIAVLCILTTAIDGFAQLLLPYESTNLKRVVFSLPTGWFGGVAIGLMINNVWFTIKEPELMAKSQKPPPQPPPPPKKVEDKKDAGPPDKEGRPKEPKEKKAEKATDGKT